MLFQHRSTAIRGKENDTSAGLVSGRIRTAALTFKRIARMMFAGARGRSHTAPRAV